MYIFPLTRALFAPIFAVQAQPSRNHPTGQLNTISHPGFVSTTACGISSRCLTLFGTQCASGASHTELHATSMHLRQSASCCRNGITHPSECEKHLPTTSDSNFYSSLDAKHLNCLEIFFSGVVRNELLTRDWVCGPCPLVAFGPHCGNGLFAQISHSHSVSLRRQTWIRP